MVLDRLRRSTLPFLVLSYPFTFLFFQGGQYCGPLCFEPTLVAVVRLLVALFVLGLIAGGVVTVLRFDERGHDGRVRRWLTDPTPLASVALLLSFAGFVGFLALDALTLYEAAWKPVVLPISFLLFLPVWVLYVVSFPLAVLFSTLGVETSSTVTLAVRGTIVIVGFPLSAAFQAFMVSAGVDALQPRDD